MKHRKHSRRDGSKDYVLVYGKQGVSRPFALRKMAIFEAEQLSKPGSYGGPVTVVEREGHHTREVGRAREGRFSTSTSGDPSMKLSHKSRAAQRLYRAWRAHMLDKLHHTSAKNRWSGSGSVADAMIHAFGAGMTQKEIDAVIDRAGRDTDAERKGQYLRGESERRKGRLHATPDSRQRFGQYAGLARVGASRPARDPGDQRVEISPHFDLWMRGDRYGSLRKVDKKGLAHIKMDKTGKVLKLRAGDYTELGFREQSSGRDPDPGGRKLTAGEYSALAKMSSGPYHPHVRRRAPYERLVRLGLAERVLQPLNYETGAGPHLFMGGYKITASGREAIHTGTSRDPGGLRARTSTRDPARYRRSRRHQPRDRRGRFVSTRRGR
jgi:hypothetical protein